MKIKYKLMLIALFLLIIFFVMQYYSNLKPKNIEDYKEAIRIELPLGTSTENIAKQLEQNGVIKSALAFRIFSKLNKLNGKYKSGIYYLNKSMDVKEITEIIQHGKGFKDTVKFTIPEGFEIRMIVDKLVELELGDKDRFYQVINNYNFNYDFLKNLPNKVIMPLEGYLFPDTYEVYKNANEEEIITKMLDRFSEIFIEEYRKRLEELEMTINEIVTLASIIEREAKVDDERKIVSSVFHNRLKINMLLGSCATVQYILEERKDVLLTKDLEIMSPYNTYKNHGLPPGPIASPGKKSLEAALYPDDTEFLYFVADKNGTHHFSKTYNEHLQAQKRINNN